MAAPCNKFWSFSEYLCGAVAGQSISVASDVFKVMLTNKEPNARQRKYADVAGNEVADGNGYTKGGVVCQLTAANHSGSETISAADVNFKASKDSVGPFRYAVLYDDTPSDKPLLCWFDYKETVALRKGEQITIEPNADSPTGSLFVLPY